jgi:hypothetical protein
MLYVKKIFSCHQVYFFHWIDYLLHGKKLNKQFCTGTSLVDFALKRKKSKKWALIGTDKFVSNSDS